MKHFALYFGLATALVASCSVQEEDFKTPQQEDVIYYASFEQPAEEGTRVYANEDLLLRWTADDRVSIFGKITYNQQYKFLGETGDNSGGFGKVDGAEYVTGNPISHTVSVYPYQASTKITEDEVLSVTLPAEQHYAENSFGLGASTMVSVSSDNVLQYKNVGGFLRISLYGGGALVESITLKGNNGEKLAGKAFVSMPLDGVPAVTMTDEATDEITLICETPVLLGSTADHSTDFWFVVPPVTFAKGFTVTINQDGSVSEKSTTKIITVDRNALSKMAPIEIERIQPDNVIYYMSLDGNPVTINKTNGFGANLVSNECSGGVGILTFDGAVTSIGDYAFMGNYPFFGGPQNNLTSISIPDSVMSIGDCAFQWCTNLSDIILSKNLTSIGRGTFGDCRSLTEIIIPEGVTSIGVGAFNYCQLLIDIELPKSLICIGARAFDGCRSLTEITLPEGVTSIGDGAFSGCNGLTSIIIPESVMSIGAGVFDHCTSLLSFGGKFASQDGLFLINEESLIAVALGAVNGSLTIPEGITSIGEGVFGGCPSLTEMIIPEGVTSIGAGAFNNCQLLTDIELPKSLMCIGVGAFDGCRSLTEITLPEGVTSIERSTFSSCTNLTTIIIPASVTSIEESSFMYCTNLTTIIIPASVTSIGSSAFRDCKSLMEIAIPEGVPFITSNTFAGCESLINVTIPESVTAIVNGAFSGCSSLSHITIPENVTEIGEYVFHNCTSLTDIIIPENVTVIGNQAFQNCTSLTDIKLPENVTVIGNQAFQNCTSLTDITIPESVTEICHQTFCGCTSLNNIIVLPETPPQGGWGFFDDTNDAPIYVPAGSIDAYKSAQDWGDYADRIQAIPSPSVPVPEAVDMGLPSGLKWASFNLGATIPHEYGDYYTWGDVEPYYSSQNPLIWKEGKEAGYAWASYKRCMGSNTTMTKYCTESDYGYNGFTDGKTVLDPEDDAAHGILGGSWRMPTDAEWTELRENCTWKWTTLGGVKGGMVTGPNGKWIFLPAAGYRVDPYLRDVGSYGYYWSSSLYTDSDHPFFARSVEFDSYYSDYINRAYNSRCLGYSVRPVCD